MGDRHAFRAKWHDYNNGIFFVTICSHKKQHTFGQIRNGEMKHSLLGCTIDACINDLVNHHEVEIHNSIVMPNHLHLVIELKEKLIDYSQNMLLGGLDNKGCLKYAEHDDKCGDFHHNSQLAIVIGSLKSASTRKYRSSMPPHIAQHPVWQSRYHEHVIRNQRSYDRIMQYVSDNVSVWDDDVFNR